jgi:hypothetical protein
VVCDEPRLLLAGDPEDIRMIGLHKPWACGDCTVVPVASGAAALKELESKPFDPLKLPDQLIRLVKENPKLP